MHIDQFLGDGRDAEFLAVRMQYAILFPIKSTGNDLLPFCSPDLHSNAEAKANAEISPTCRERSVPSPAPGFTA